MGKLDCTADIEAQPCQSQSTWLSWKNSPGGPLQLVSLLNAIKLLGLETMPIAVNQLGVTTVPAREWDSCRLCFLAQFLRSRRTICSTDRTYKLPGSHVWAVLSSEKSRSPAKAIKVTKSRHNSRTNLRTKVLSMQIRANIDISLYCLFQRLVFSERKVYTVPLQHKVWYKGYVSQSLTAVGTHLPWVQEPGAYMHVRGPRAIANIL